MAGRNRLGRVDGEPNPIHGAPYKAVPKCYRVVEVVFTLGDHPEFTCVCEPSWAADHVVVNPLSLLTSAESKSKGGLMSMGPFRAPVACAVVTLMITPHGTAQAPSTSKTANPREASSGRASGREASSGMATGRGEASSGQASGSQDQFPKASGAITE